ncbi:MAG: 6-bladed beta-propeller, partial [Gammaproteobacteria bacterium]|nr:6-bladed beta-propeller [Gammaproteobacteria bacterium]
MKNNKQSMFLVLLLGSIVFLAACTSSSDKKEVEFVVPVFPPPPETPRFTYIDTIRSSADVLKEDSTSAFRRFATGEQRIGQGFSKPYSVIVQDGRIYVGDTVRHTVMVMDPEGEGKFFEIGKTEPGKLTSPMGMAKDAKGNIYVNDAKAKKVVVYDRDGNFITTFGGKDYFQRLSGIAVDPDGKRAFVVDTGGVQSQEHRIRVFDVASGKHEYDIGTRGTADGQFNLPVSAVINKFNGLLYVVDSGNFRVQVFNQDGTFVNKFGDVGRRTGQFSRPKGISSDKQG